ncbi:response regulator transcription factor [candidate division KSB1 bacterium]|nr:response regulator transcription factor [candidate division KSB1 bacterium]
MPQILIIEDEPEMIMGLKDNFLYEGYEVLTAENGVEGIEKALTHSPDLVLLDIMLPQKSGFDVCRELKSKNPDMPIIMLTARGQEIDKVLGLELGADDYITKPFSVRELLARVKAVLRRTAGHRNTDNHQYVLEDFTFDFKHYQARKGSRQIEFTHKEYQMLKYFVQHKGEILSRYQILDDVWGYEATPTTRTVDNHILKLRQKIEPDPAKPKYILTVHGIGYKFIG